MAASLFNRLLFVLRLCGVSSYTGGYGGGYGGQGGYGQYSQGGYSAGYDRYNTAPPQPTTGKAEEGFEGSK